MIARCNCGITATIRQIGRSQFSPTGLPHDWSARCPIISKKLKERGRLDFSEVECESLGKVCQDVFEEWQRRRSRL